jgi:3-oxoacyl-[acyl-carrier protein] reductase
MDLNLANRRALVTAASGGIGLAAAEALCGEGAAVLITSSNAANVTEAAQEIRGRVRDAAIGSTVLDLRDPESIAAGVARAIDELGGLDILVTNHGGPPNRSLAETDIDTLDDWYDQTIRSTAMLCRQALPALRDGGGTITHLVGASARQPRAGAIVGAMLRPGLFGLSKALSREEGPHGVRSNCVAPRGISSDRITSKLQARAEREGTSVKDIEAQRTSAIPLGRFGTPDEFARAVAFISSPAASYITGSVLPVDGGWSAML